MTNKINQSNTANDSVSPPPLPSGVQYLAEIFNGKLRIQQGFFFPGINFFYAELDDNKNCKNLIQVQFTRNSNNFHLVNYAFFAQQELQQNHSETFKSNSFNPNNVSNKHFSSSPFLLLSHPDYTKEITPGVYEKTSLLNQTEYLATAVMIFLGIAHEKETLKHFHAKGFAVANANLANNGLGIKHNSTETQPNTEVDLPSFVLWQPAIKL